MLFYDCKFSKMSIQGNGGISFAWSLKYCPKELQNTLFIVQWSFEIFLIFPNFLYSYVLSHSAALEPAHIYYIYY